MLLAVRISSYEYNWEVWRETQEAGVALGCASSNSYASLVFVCIHNSIYAH